MYIGIDLGTTNSAIAGVVDGKIRLFKTADGADVLPSVIYVDKRGHRLYGKRAYEQASLSPENVAKGFKRIMGTSSLLAFKASNTEASPEDCSAEILRQLIGQAIVESGKAEISGAVITIPAAFNQMQSEATLRAAHAAGLERVALLQEPVAAAMSAMAGAKKRNGQFLVYDLGGGTFDLALVQSVSGTVNIIGHEGINMLGGQDFDSAIVTGVVYPWLMENFSLPKNFQKSEKYRRVVGLSQLAAEQAKIELSTKDEVTIFVSDEYTRVVDDEGKEVFVEIPLTRTVLDSLVAPRVSETVALAHKLLKDSGYSPQDIDRVVLVGGPSKMPFIREQIPKLLGIPTDSSVDPMTAVAIGAAIFCESRQWDGENSSRKTAKTTTAAEGAEFVRYDYPARTSDETVTVRLKLSDPRPGYNVQIDATTGWTSGRVSVADGVFIKLPIGEPGENRFRATLFDVAGRPSGTTLLTIQRAHASAAGIPATQTIAVKVRDGAGGRKNILVPLLAKGTILPARGSMAFTAAHDLDPAMAGPPLELEVYQDEGAPEPEKNLSVGVFRVSHSDLTEGTKVRKGDQVVFHWNVDESGILKASVELPSVMQTFETRRFYVDQAGHQSFDGADGAKLANTILASARQELEALRSADTSDQVSEVDDLEKRLDEQDGALESASTADEQRAVTEKGRHLRQQISRIKSRPEYRGAIIEKAYDEVVANYNASVREFADPVSNRRFDELADSCVAEMGKQTPKGFVAAETALDEMNTIHHRNLIQNPGFVVQLFKSLTEERHMSTDKGGFDRLVTQGIEALKNNDSDQLRRIVSALLDNRIDVGGTTTVDRLASVYRA